MFLFVETVGGSFLELKKGDLIGLEEEVEGGEWLTGYNVKTGDWGEFPASSVMVLATILQPAPNIVVRIKRGTSSFRLGWK